ncbi:single tm domain protein [Entamoeba histolytica]|uniref:Single tm domain protein n=1 Tax=Entamoeba histolytica TaxID=5759 RepID=A0A175JZA2_ENTHI|nr:single tm domain protein [Entamoeba histolytica]
MSSQKGESKITSGAIVEGIAVLVGLVASAGAANVSKDVSRDVSRDISCDYSIANESSSSD